MSDIDDLQELLFFFSDALAIEVEMPMGEFEAVQIGAATLSTLAGRTVKAAYAGVGDGLVVRGIVLFTLTVDASGALAVPFNLPLKHLLRHAGPGPDIGHGRIRLASRTQCPVPWHARQLWHCEDDAVLRRVQHAVFHNASGLLPRRAPTRAESSVASAADALTGPDSEALSWGGVSTEALRTELGALRDKLRNTQEEMARLRAALRHEQDRNRRLQDRLLGDAQSR